MPSSTARFPAPAAAASDDVGFAATLVPSSTAMSPAQPAPVPAPADDRAFAATHVPSSTARFPAPVAQPPPASPAPVPPAPSAPPSPGVAPVAAQQPYPGRPSPMKDPRVLVLVLGLVAAGWWFGSRSTQAPVSAAPVPVAATAPVAQAAPPPEKPAETKTPPAPEPAAPAVAATAAPAVTESKPASSKPTRPAIDEPLAPEVRDALQDAEKALRAGDLEEATRLGLFAQRKQPTAAAVYSVLVRAYCSQGDRGNANGKWREGYKMLSSKDRGSLKTYCMQHEVELKL
jgi:hypothetical protein